jgi:hypothetical protein
VIDTNSWTDTRWPISPDAHPTNLIPRGNHLFVTDDTTQAVLRADL